MSANYRLKIYLCTQANGGLMVLKTFTSVTGGTVDMCLLWCERKLPLGYQHCARWALVRCFHELHETLFHVECSHHLPSPTLAHSRQLSPTLAHSRRLCRKPFMKCVKLRVGFCRAENFSVRSCDSWRSAHLCFCLVWATARWWDWWSLIVQ